MAEELDNELEVEDAENSENDATGENTEGAENEITGEESENNAETEFTVTIEGEEELAKDPNWLKNLRKENREFKKKQKELERQLAEITNKEKQDVEIGPKPTLSDSDIDYNTDKYAEKLAAWIERKQKVVEKENREKDSLKQQQDDYDRKLVIYNEGKTKLPVKDMAEVEDQVKTFLSPQKQGIIVKCAKNPALLVYAIGSNEATLKKLAAITDLAEFSYTLGELENKMKTSNKRVPETQPEKTITGSGSKTSSIDKQLEKLRDEAAKTGNMSKVHAYKRKLREKG